MAVPYCTAPDSGLPLAVYTKLIEDSLDSLMESFLDIEDTVEIKDFDCELAVRQPQLRSAFWTSYSPLSLSLARSRALSLSIPRTASDVDRMECCACVWGSTAHTS